jgi:hypothetical protein
VKLVTFDDGKVGRVEDGVVHELDVESMREYFERGGADDAGREYALEDVKLRAPIVPKKFFHTAGNFREHEEESKTVGWSHEIAPWIVFFQNVDAIVGPGEPVVYPEHLTQELDYELELAVVLRKSGKWFSPEEAMDYVGGYVIFNDITARDIQRLAERNAIPHPIIADPELKLAAALQLPTFDAGGETLYKRLALVAEACAIAKVFYPVFSPNENAPEVVAWLESHRGPVR